MEHSREPNQHAIVQKTPLAVSVTCPKTYGLGLMLRKKMKEDILCEKGNLAEPLTRSP